MSNSILALAIVRAMDRHGYAVSKGPGEVNIVYVEGATFKGTGGTLVAEGNGNKPNLWNDVRIVLQFVSGAPVITNLWQATTEPGTRYTVTPINESGAARITLGQQKCWQVGLHRGYEALAQTGDVVMVTRDKNKDFSRANDKVTKGFYGINQHHGHDAPENNIGPNSAGCLVGRTVKGHKEFMALIKTDPRYVATHKFVFATTILEAADVIVGELHTVVPSRPDAKAPAKMILKLTAAAVAKCFPGAPSAIVDAFVNDQASLAKAGILDTPERLADCFANLSHEVNDFKIAGLTENIKYTHERAAQVWPNRYSSGAAVRAKFGTGAGWQRKLMDDVYGSRMGNRPKTSDGSEYIGRGGPQITGRDGYREVGKRAGLDLENNPDLAALPENQPAIVAAFWTWKNMNAATTFLARVKLWNGGTNGLADREARRARILPIAKSLARGPMATPEVIVTGGVVAAGGAAVAHQASKPDSGWGSIAFIAGAVIVVAVIAFMIIRSMRKQ